MSAAREYRERLAQVAGKLPEDKLTELLDFADFLSERNGGPPDVLVREIGALDGEIEVLPSFFDPLPEDIQAAFEGRTK